MAKRAATTEASPDAPVIALIGDEELLKQETLVRLRAALAKKHGDVQPMHFDGESAQLSPVLDELRTYGLLQDYKLVIVDNADKFVSAHREALERYTESPSDQATLVLRPTTFPSNTRLYKAIEKIDGIARCEPLAPAAIGPWLLQRANSVHKTKITQDAAALLAERLTGDLLRLDSELAKLAVLAGEGKPIGVEHVQQVVGRSSDEEAWAIREAILQTLAEPDGAEGGRALVEKFHELVDLAGNDAVPIGWAITTLMRDLYVAAVLRKQGPSDGELGARLGLRGPPWAHTTFLSVAKKVDASTAQRWLDRAFEAVRRARTGAGDELLNLECFCAQLADELG